MIWSMGEGHAVLLVGIPIRVFSMDKTIPSNSISVLLIESPDRVASISRALNSETPHYNLKVLHSLSESRKYLSETLPDIIIADLKLPDGYGIELLTATHKTLSCPLILLAEESSRREAYEALQKGASDYILTDVTPAYEIPRIVERVLNQKNFALENSQRKVESLSQRMTDHILDHVVDGIITIDDKGIIKSLNRAAEKIFGYSFSEVIDKNISMLMPEPYQSQHNEYLQKYMDTGIANIIGVGREVEGLRKNGTVFPIDLAVSEVYLEDKRFFTGIVRDITERKQHDQELFQSKLEAEKTSLAKSDFLARMSHELRTPLNSIMGFSQLLEMAAVREKYPENQVNFIEQILRAGSHLLELINEVLDLSRVESGKIETHPEPVDIKNLLNEMVAFMQPIAQKGEVIISNDTELTGCSMIKADKGLLKQCILNLLSNAIKYNQEKGEVHLHCRTMENKNIQICVTDTGPGLSEEQQASLFQPFERLGAENSEIEGSGIGLTITKKIVELMGGTVGCESQLGKGSTFFIELPVYGEEEPSMEPVKATPRPKKAPQGKNIFKIFYIEDNQANLALIEHTLSRYSNIQLSSAFNGRQGIQKIQEYIPDLILLDMGLPDMEGLDVLRELKTNQQTKDIPIVVLSANALQSHINKSKDLGIERYLTKPIDIQEFADVINQYTN